MISQKFWRHIELRLITKENLYYAGGTLCVDTEKGGVALNIDGKGFVYGNHQHLKNSKVYIPEHISSLVHQIYKELKGEKLFYERTQELLQLG
jgi:hypothetical protein